MTWFVEISRRRDDMRYKNSNGQTEKWRPSAPRPNGSRAPTSSSSSSERERERETADEWNVRCQWPKGKDLFFFSSTARRIEIPSRTKKRRRVNKVTEEAERTRDCVPSPTTAAANPSKSKRGDQNGTLDPSLIRLKPSRYTCGGLVGLLYTQPL